MSCCSNPKPSRLQLSLVMGTMCSVPMLAQAAGFALIEQSGSGIGTAFAGSAASGDDASAMFFNPANLSLLKHPEIAVAAHGINLDIDYRDRSSTLPAAGLGQLPAGATRDEAGDLVPLPNIYLALPIGEKLAFGLGVNAPFGLITEYSDPWIGRFQGIRTELASINVNPAVSFRLSDSITIGAGANYQYAEAELTNAVMLAPTVEGRALVDVDDDTWGWNAGALFKLPSNTRIGVSYRSSLDYSLIGDTTVTTLQGATVAAVSGPTQVDVTFPDSAFVSVVQPLGDMAEIRADVSWTNWSTVGTILAVNPATGTPRDALQFAFEDSWRAALGVSGRTSERWTVRGGFAWDESPVQDQFRTVRLPDADRYWVSIGARWQPLNSLSVDLGYAHLFVEKSSIANTRGQLGGPVSFGSTVVGDYEGAVDIVSAQLTWSFR